MTRLAGMRRMAGSRRSLRRGMFAGGGLHPPRATPCSLVQRTGSGRRMAVLKQDRARLAAAAHRGGATTNDAVLVAVAAALHQILLNMNESIDPIVVTVPVSGRRSRGGREVGNLVSPMLVNVPTGGGVAERLADVEAAVRARKVAATGSPPIAVLGGFSCSSHGLGAYHFYVNLQRRFHTLVTHVRGWWSGYDLVATRWVPPFRLWLPTEAIRPSTSRSSRTPAQSSMLIMAQTQTM